jgi:hypothetical protein
MGLSFRTRLIRYAVRLANRHPLPKRIPLSDREKVVARKYAGAYLTQKGKRRFYAETVTPTGIDGRWFETPDAPSVPKSVTNEELDGFDVQFSQYYAEAEFDYTSAFEFVVWQWLGLPWLVLQKGRLLQWLHNRRKLATEARMAVLKRFLEHTQEDNDYKTGIDRYLTELYGPRWQGHEDSLKVYYFHELLFKSLVQTGELNVQNGTYEITPKAVVTLESFEEADKRHREMARLQLVLIIVTGALVVIGFAQAYSGLVAAGKPLSALWR